MTDSWKDVIEGRDALRIEAPDSATDLTDGRELRDRIEAALGTLRPRLADVLRRWNGIGCPEQTLEEIGRDWQVTREVVRQQEVKALYVLRTWMLKKGLAEFVEGSR